MNHLTKLLQREKIEFSICETKDQFLPSPWKEIVIALVPAVVGILYDFVKTRKGKSKITLETSDTTMELNADGLKQLDLRLKNKRKKRKQKNV